MMPGIWHKLLKAVEITLLSLLGILAVVLIALYVVVDSGLPERLMSEYDRTFLDADMEVSDFSLSGFGTMTLKLDSLRITYPHGTFPEPLAYEKGGSGPRVDTLFSADRILLRFKPLRMLRLKRFSIPEANVSGLKAYLRCYNDSLSNLSVFRSSSPKDTAEVADLKFAVRNLSMDGNPVIEYSDRRKGMSARMTLESLSAGAIVRVSPEGFGMRKANLSIENLGLGVTAGVDSCRLMISGFRLDEPRPDRFDVSLRSQASANMSLYGEMDAPFDLDATFDVIREDSGYSFDISSLVAYAAHIPLSADGLVKVGSGSPYFRMDISASSCPLDTLMQEYSAFVPGLEDVLYMNGRLSLGVSIDGSFTDGSLPEMTLRADLPRSSMVYKPQDLHGSVSLEMDAEISPSKTMNAIIHKLSCEGEGFRVSAGAEASGLLSGDPTVSLEAGLAADLEKMASAMRFDFPVDAHGNLDLGLKWNARLSEIRSMHLDKTAIAGHISSDNIRIDADSLRIKAYNADADIASGGEGVALSVGMDSLFLDSGESLSVRLRDTRNRISLTMAPRRSGTLTPKLFLSSENGRAFVKTGPHRFFGSSLEVEASAHKKNIANLLKRNLFLDSLQRIYPDVPRHDLVMIARDSLFKSRPVPAFLADKALMRGDIDISLDTSKTTFLQKWSLSGDVSMNRGGFASTKMPLRTRFSGLDLHYDGRNLAIDTLGVVCGTSDLGIKGHVDGLGKALVSRSRLNFCADLHSNRLNLNEIISAFKIGGELKLSAQNDIEDVSFVTDTLQDVVPELPPMKLVIVPANLNVDLNALLDSVYFTYFRLNPLRAKVLMKDRTLQFIDSGFLSNYGDLSLDAFYSTISTKDVSAGVNLSLSSLNAGQIIAMLPSVDKLMPALKTFKGNFDCNLSATAKLDANMNVIPSAMDGLLRIKGSRLRIDDAGSLKKLTTTLMFKNKDIGEISDFSASAVLHSGKLEVFPFEFSVDRYRVALWGMQGMDRSLYYHISLLKSPLIFNFGINIYGTLDKWRWSLTSARYKDGKIPTFSKELDSMQLNISDYVRNIYSRGVSNISTYNKESMKAVVRKEDALDISSVEDYSGLSTEDFKKIDAALVDYQLKRESEELEQEIESVLEDSFRQTSQMMDSYVSDFETTACDDRTRRRMERMKSRKK